MWHLEMSVPRIVIIGDGIEMYPKTLTGIVDKRINVPWVSLDLLKCLIDRLIARKVDFE